jgi:outer membrane protein OmpA-like peptidoglycan-associated protein
MKKLMFVLAFVGMTSFALAQETTVPVKKYSVATNSFWSNWFITVGGNYNAFYGDQQHGLGLNNSPLKDFRRDWGFGVGIGKSFTPGFALRTKFSGLWGKSVTSEICHENKDMKHYFTINEQMMFNMSNLLFGYNENRVWNLIPYIGAGILRNCTSNVYALDVTGGIMSTWKVADKVDIFLDATVLMAEGKADGHTVAHTQSLCLKNYDMIYSLEAGLKFNLGKSTWAKVPDVDALMAMNKEQLDALNASLRDAQAENARLKNLLANQKPVAETKEVVKKELATTAQSVFFNINKSKIASRKDLVNVQEVAKYAKANGNKIVVTGYADSKTGKAAYNQTLSQKRAETVANELVKMGVSRDNIIVKAAGGVNDLSPISYNRRATVELQ